MKFHKYFLIIFLLLVQYKGESQSACKDIYRQAVKLYQEGNSILKEPTTKISKRIKKSKKKYTDALVLLNNCTGNYTMIQDRKIDEVLLQLKFRLGRIDELVFQFEEEFESSNPGWKDINKFPRYSMAGIRKFILVEEIKSLSFYDEFELKNGVVVNPLGKMKRLDLESLIRDAKILHEKYGSIYSLRFMQSNGIVINGTSKELNGKWQELNELVVKCLLELKSKNELLEEYENSKIIGHDSKLSRNILYPKMYGKVNYYYTTVYKINVFSVQIHISGVYNRDEEAIENFELDSVKNSNYFINAIKNAP